METYINLIRQITWSFNRTTGIDWNELFGEACLAYCEALLSYKPEGGSKMSTWLFICIKNKLLTFCTAEHRNKIVIDIDFDWTEDIIYPDYEFFELTFRSLPRSAEFKALPKDCQYVITIILRNPLHYALPPRKVLGKIRLHLREEWKWTYPRIWKCMKSLREELIEIN
ncbi:hypothetical protein LCGC14_1195820 [marine sediment metagenome]|uniref:RNA polymerase sigma-70 region 2 domain-containing protein n=1 Tax=marine sediment metagenome TaxID=412755 RepID=A0A0F9M5Q9_9ZZZZ